MVEKRQGNFERKSAHLPQGLAAVETERAEAIRRGEPLQTCALEPAPPPQIAHVAISLGGEAVADRDEALRIVLAQAVDLAKPEAKRKSGITSSTRFLVMPAQAGIQYPLGFVIERPGMTGSPGQAGR